MSPERTRNVRSRVNYRCVAEVQEAARMWLLWHCITVRHCYSDTRHRPSRSDNGCIMNTQKLRCLVPIQ